MRKPKLDLIEREMAKGKDFVLTDEQYLDKTGAPFPQRKSYAQNKSAVAKLALRHNYRIVVIPKEIWFERMKEK